MYVSNIIQIYKVRMDIESLRQTLLEHGQDHLLQFWDVLADKERESLYEDLMAINYANVLRFFKTCKEEMSRDEKLDDYLEPLPSEVCGSFGTTDTEQLKNYEQEGLYSLELLYDMSVNVLKFSLRCCF